MSLLNRILTLSLGLFLVSSGIAKFTGGHVFRYIEYRSGIGLFDPYVGVAIGVAEVVAGGFILFRSTRLAGAALAGGVMVGAVGFHLSPWLGVSMPTGLVDGAVAPWTAADFATTTTAVPFGLAAVTLLGSATIVRHELHRRSADRAAAATGDRIPVRL